MTDRSQPTEDHETGTRHGISRREMVQKLMGGASSGFIASTVAGTHLAEAQPIDVAAPQADAKPPSDTNALRFFDPHQYETLVVLAEIIIPGSTKAGVARFVDLLLSVDTTENQRNFVASLSAMDGESLRRYSSPFKYLTEAGQIKILTDSSTTAHHQSPEDEMRPASAAASEAVPLAVLHDHFENLKSWISKAYYSSEAGMRELGWKDAYFYETFTE
jgi:hypothetical protein